MFQRDSALLFPRTFCQPTLKKFNVPEDKWDAIVRGLADKNKDVLRLVEEKASKLDPNPFKGFDPSQRAAAVKIFRETLTQVFSEVLKANGVSDDTQIAQMLEDIQRQKAANFAKCREKEMHTMQPGSQSTPGSQPMQGGQNPQGAPNQGSYYQGQSNSEDHPADHAQPYLSDATTPQPKKPYGTAPKGDDDDDDNDHDDDDHDEEQRG